MDPLSLVGLDKIVEQAKTLIAIPSVSGSEQELVDWLENFFESIGLTDVQRFPVKEAGDTLIGWIRGPYGGNTCEANEWVDISSMQTLTKTLIKSTLELLEKPEQ